eukprot:gene33994-38421_t
MKASWKPQAKKPRFSSQKPRCVSASAMACRIDWPGRCGALAAA